MMTDHTETCTHAHTHTHTHTFPQTSEKQMIAREQGQEKAEGASENVIYKIEVPANR